VQCYLSVVLILKALFRVAAETDLTNDERFSLNIIMNNSKTSFTYVGQY
jgi:hypothetical protein